MLHRCGQELRPLDPIVDATVVDGTDEGVVLGASRQPAGLPGVRERWKFARHALEKSPVPGPVPMLGSVGCPYTCAFCIDSQVPYQPLEADHWISVARGPPRDMVDANGEFRKTFGTLAPELGPELERAEHAFEKKTVAELIADDMRAQYATLC